MANNVEDCPIPEVADALRPYIRTREEASAIRRGLHNYLESQLGPQEAPLSPITLPLPSNGPLVAPPAPLTGVRRAYWKALQAHTAAQAKYDDLRAELELLKHSKSVPAISAAETPTSINDDYLPLLRQREKQRKLKAIEKAHSRVTAAGVELSTSTLDEIVKRQLGEAPTPPRTPPSSNQNTDVDTKLLDLKKALISTNRSIEERKIELDTYQTNTTTPLSNQAQIAGLQAALQELTGWMESQLSVIADSESDAQSTQTTTSDRSNSSAAVSASNIEAQYEKYLESRRRLIHAIRNPATNSPDTDLNDIMTLSANSSEVKPSAKSSAEVILPYIPTLQANRQREQSLLQQSAYMRQRIASAEAETESLIRRLAGESHLVPAEATRGEDWAKAAEQAGKEMEKVVDERVRAGRESLRSARKALAGIHGLTGSVDGVVD